MVAAPSCLARPQDHPPVTLADIVRAHGAELGPVSPQQARALSAIAECRTSALGGHRWACEACGFQHDSFNSCRNRHCPQCQGLEQSRWVERRQEDLLPVEYFHVVFTLPSELRDVFLINKTVAYGLLLSTAAETLIELAKVPRYLGAHIGVMAVLHTWTQTLTYHPHVHCIVPGGGPSPDGSTWVFARRKFFLHVRALSVLMRGKLLAALERALLEGRMIPTSSRYPLRDLRRAARKKWNVNCEPSFVGPEDVIRYLGRYTRRIAISNGRLVSLEKGQVTFKYLDRASDQWRTMTVPAEQFLRRFLLHVLPHRFARIRYYGGLAHPIRKKWLAASRALLTASGATMPARPAHNESETWQEELLRLTGIDVTRCPQCKVGRMFVIELLRPQRSHLLPPARAAPT